MDIQVNDLSKSFNKKIVLDQITLTISCGEILCLLGPSGAGKTTLIRSIIGALKTDLGTITIANTPIPNRQLMYDIGYMPQEEALYPDLTGYDNLKFFSSIYKLKGTKQKKRIDELMTKLDLSADKNKLVSEYSGGMKKRLSLAIALLHNPTFLLLDEPTVGIDPVLRKEIWNQFITLKNSGHCIIVSTHVMDEAQKCDRTALIYNGKIIYDDSTNALLEKTTSGNIEELFFMAKENIIC